MTDTNTAVATTEQQRPKPPAVQAGGTISAMIPTDIDQAFRLARAIAMSGMAPKAYGQDENKCFVGILAGAELGLAPFQALQSIAVIGGNPSVWGDGALALVRASGLLEDFEETDDGHKATCRAVRRGETPIIREFDMDDAKKAGLLGKAGPWTQYPRRMRQMRARAWALRDGFADVLKGLHIVEEVRDRPDLAEKPQTMKLSSDMLAQQAGVTVEQAATVEPMETVEAEVEEISDGQFEADEARRARLADDIQDDEMPGTLSEAAQQALDDIDGPLDDDQAEDDGPDPREAIADGIIAEIDKITTIIDLQHLRSRKATDIDALPDELSGKVKRAFKTMQDALQGRAG